LFDRFLTYSNIKCFETPNLCLITDS